MRVIRVAEMSSFIKRRRDDHQSEASNRKIERTRRPADRRRACPSSQRDPGVSELKLGHMKPGPLSFPPLKLCTGGCASVRRCRKDWTTRQARSDAIESE